MRKEVRDARDAAASPKLLARRERNREAVRNHKLRQAGEAMPTTPEGIRAWWAKRGVR